jgi:type I restriction enzyme R subunit
MPLFRMFSREIFGDGGPHSSPQPGVAETQTPFGIPEEDRISHLVDLTQRIFLVVERELKLTGFWESIPARNKLRAEIQKILLGPEFAKLPKLIKNRAHIITRIMEFAENKNDTILYAE